MSDKTVVIISVTSDIGTALAKRYSKEGYTIVGTYRSTGQLDELRSLPKCHLLYCDVSDIESISKFVKQYSHLGLYWHAIVLCPCTPLPLESFFKCSFDEWSSSIHINAIEQLRILHQLHCWRKQDGVANVVFFAGGGVNNSVVNFSAYTLSKIMLIKMCEFIDAENSDLNIFIVGPGWTRTKVHNLILEKVSKDDQKYQDTIDFLAGGVGTSMDDIYECIQWLCGQGKSVASGRNFSVVHDMWKGDNSVQLARELAHDPDMYKLRRYRNDYRTENSTRKGAE